MAQILEFPKPELDWVELQQLVELTGFPLEIIKTELLLDSNLGPTDKVSMKEFRFSMLKYLDQSLYS